MIGSSIHNTKGKEELSSLFAIEDVLSVRLYYVAASLSQREDENGASINSPSVDIELLDDGSTLRTQLHSVLQLKSKQYYGNTNIGSKDKPVNIPAFTITVLTWWIGIS